MKEPDDVPLPATNAQACVPHFKRLRGGEQVSPFPAKSPAEFFAACFDFRDRLHVFAA